MSSKEKATDLWVYDLLKEANIKLDAQGSTIEEIDDALKTASKRGTGKVGYPEYVGIVKDFILVIEDKRSLSNHEKRLDDHLLAEDSEAICDYAVNGALFYGKHLIKNTTYTKVIAIGVSGSEKKHRMSPIFINDRLDYYELPEIETFISFNKNNIYEYYTKEILKENTNFEKETKEILKDAARLHEDLRNYGSIQDRDKPLIVSGILLALREIEYGSFSINSLTGDSRITDGQKIYNAIEANLQRANVSPEVKRDKLLNQFAVIKDTTKINQVNPTLGKTPNKHYTEFLYQSIFQSIRYHQSSEDYLGRFYGEFMSYSGGDGQSLGIVLTPKHITELFCELLEVKPTDKVIDPCCGTAGFLIAAMHYMLQQTDDEFEKDSIRKHQLFGIEDQSYMFTIATTNMILRGDGKSNLENQDFLKQNPAKLQLKGCTVGMMNPPYSQGSKSNTSLYEISFTEHLLDSIVEGGRVAVIVPQSSMTGKTKYEKEVKANILKHHTLEGVITLNPNTFYEIGVHPCIAIFTAGIPHRKEKICKFINFKDDGFEVSKHIGLMETPSASDKKQHLLDVWFDRIESETKFCVKSTVEAADEWLHSFYYFNDEIPTDSDFEKTIGDYLSFQFSMVMQNREYLFEENNRAFAKKQIEGLEYNEVVPIEEKQWGVFHFFNEEGLATIASTKSSIDKVRLVDGENKVIPYVTRGKLNNGLDRFVDDKNLSSGFDKGGCITVGLDTQTAFWQEYDFVTGQNVQVITGKHINYYVGQFLIPLLKKQMDAKFNWGGNGATLSRMKKLNVLLPINHQGDPDYAYMEQYTKNVMLKKYQQYLSFLDNQS